MEGATQLEFDVRPSDSPYVSKVWRIENHRVLPFISVAKPSPFLVFGRHQGKLVVTYHGPETRATPAETPSEAEFTGIFLRNGASVPLLPNGALVDGWVELLAAGGDGFWLAGRTWEAPTFENADTFLAVLAAEGLLALDDVVRASLRGEVPGDTSRRSIQRRFLRATGLTWSTVMQILRAQKTARILMRGTPVLDAVEASGFFDQAHLTKALARYFGQSPGRMLKAPAASSLF